MSSPQKDAIQSVMTSILSSVQTEAQQSELFKMLSEDPSMGDPSQFFFNYQYPLRNALEAWLRGNVEGLTNERSASLFVEVFSGYEEFYESHLSSIFERMEGSFACADKAGFVLGEFFRQLRGVEPSQWDTERFWVPKAGNREQWMGLCEALVGLRHGNYKPYVEIREAIQAESDVLKAQKKADEKIIPRGPALG